MSILFATAELAPHVKVGGLADFSAGLTRMLRAKGQDVHVVLPDYGLDEFVEQERAALDVPGWVSPSTARIGRIGSEHVTLIRFPGSERPTPYLVHRILCGRCRLGGESPTVGLASQRLAHRSDSRILG